MQFIQGNNRHQTYFSTLEDQVIVDIAARLIDAFIDKLELQKLGFTNTIHKSEGCPRYAPHFRATFGSAHARQSDVT